MAKVEPQRPLQALLRRWLFAAIFACLVIPFAFWRDYFARDTYVAWGTRFEYVEGLLILALLAASMRYLARPSIAAAAVWAWIMVGLTWSINTPNTALNALGLAAYILAVIALARSPDIYRALRYAGWTIVIGLIGLGVWLGPEGRTFGGAQPNMLGHLALAAAFMFALCGRLGWRGVILTAAFLVFTQSRTVLLGYAVFLAFRYLVMPWSRRTDSVFAPPAIAAAGMTLILLLQAYFTQVLIGFSHDIGVVEKSRLTGSLTGRTRFFEAGWRLFDKNPIFGYGFATREKADLSLGDTISAHSGAINLLVELGVIGAALFALWYLAALWRTLREMRDWPDGVAATCASIMIGMLPILFAEPMYLSLWDPQSLVLMIALSMPFVTRATRPVRHARAAGTRLLHSRTAPVRLRAVEARRSLGPT